MFMTDLGNRYTAPDEFYRGTRFLDEVETLAQEVARKVFRARYADVRPLSGHVADMAVLMSCTQRGDTIVSIHPDKGGYPGVSHYGLGKLLGLRNAYFPYVEELVNIDVVGSRSLLKSEAPRVVFFGASFIPFPHPIREIAADDGNCLLVYDASHVMGLIAGGEFQDPLREGCSLMIGSTHKSLPGPQGGIILSNNEDAFERVSGQIHPGIVDNFHLNRVAALAVALLEMLEFGKVYASNVVKNSSALARALVARGVPLRGASRGYTRSHQVLLDYDSPKLVLCAERLEKANIVIDVGGRIGTAEMTRMGYGPQQMEEVAELVSMILLGRKPAEFVKKKVRSLVKDFKDPKYVLKTVSTSPA